MTTSEQHLNAGSGAAASADEPMSADDWKALYDQLARATRAAIGQEPENDWHVFSAAKLSAHDHYLALEFPDEPEALS